MTEPSTTDLSTPAPRSESHNQWCYREKKEACARARDCEDLLEVVILNNERSVSHYNKGVVVGGMIGTFKNEECEIFAVAYPRTSRPGSHAVRYYYNKQVSRQVSVCTFEQCHYQYVEQWPKGLHESQCDSENSESGTKLKLEAARNHRIARVLMCEPSKRNSILQEMINQKPETAEERSVRRVYEEGVLPIRRLVQDQLNDFEKQVECMTPAKIHEILLAEICKNYDTKRFTLHMDISTNSALHDWLAEEYVKHEEGTCSTSEGFFEQDTKKAEKAKFDYWRMNWQKQRPGVRAVRHRAWYTFDVHMAERAEYKAWENEMNTKYGKSV